MIASYDLWKTTPPWDTPRAIADDAAIEAYEDEALAKHGELVNVLVDQLLGDLQLGDRAQTELDRHLEDWLLDLPTPEYLELARSYDIIGAPPEEN